MADQVVRSRSVARLRSLGADEVINADTTSFETQNRTGRLASLSREIDEGKVKPFIGRTYSLAEAARAWKDYEPGRIEGKLVINVTDMWC